MVTRPSLFHVKSEPCQLQDSGFHRISLPNSSTYPRNLQQDPLNGPRKNLSILIARSQLTFHGVRWDSVPFLMEHRNLELDHFHSSQTRYPSHGNSSSRPCQWIPLRRPGCYQVFWCVKWLVVDHMRTQLHEFNCLWRFPFVNTPSIWILHP